MLETADDAGGLTLALRAAWGLLVWGEARTLERVSVSGETCLG